MKKLNGRLVVSAILAAAMMSMTAVSAGAINYTPDGVPTTVTPEESSVLTDKDVSDALKDAAKSGADEVGVEMEEDANGSVAVQESAIAEIAKGDVAVTVVVESASGEEYSVTIDPDLIKEAKAIDLGMDIAVGTKEGTEASGVEVPAGSIVIAPKQKGDFGMTLQVNLSAASLAGVDPNTAKLFYIGDDGKVTQMPGNALTFNSDGSASVFIDHASQYVISSVDILLEGDSQVDSGNATVVDEGKKDNNPHTGVALALGALAASAAAVAITAKKRK